MLRYIIQSFVLKVLQNILPNQSQAIPRPIIMPFSDSNMSALRIVHLRKKDPFLFFSFSYSSSGTSLTSEHHPSFCIGVGRFRILGGGGARFRIPGGGQIPAGT